MINSAIFGGFLMLGMILLFAGRREVLPKRPSKVVAFVCFVSAAFLLVFT